MALTLPRFVLVVLAGLPACHPPEARLEVPSARAGSEHASLVAALRKLCEPISAPLERPAWSRDQLKIDLFDQVELSSQDLDEILALATAAGLTEPVALSAGNRRNPGRNYQVWLDAPVVENPGSLSRSQRTLCITNPEWEMKRSYAFEPKVGDWKLVEESGRADRLWREWTQAHVRDGAFVWDFNRSESVSRATALELLQAIGEGNYLVDDGVELSEGSLRFSSGYLGMVHAMKDWRDAIDPRPEADECNWEYQLEPHASQSQGVEIQFVRRNGNWIIVGASRWVS